MISSCIAINEALYCTINLLFTSHLHFASSNERICEHAEPREWILFTSLTLLIGHCIQEADMSVIGYIAMLQKEIVDVAY